MSAAREPRTERHLAHDLHRAVDTRDWLRDSDLAHLDDEPHWPSITPEERARRAAMREALRQAHAEHRISARQWALYAVVLVLTLIASAFFPDHWASYGWSFRP